MQYSELQNSNVWNQGSKVLSKARKWKYAFANTGCAVDKINYTKL